MSRTGDLARPRRRQDNFYTDLNLVCDLESDLTPSSSRLQFQEYFYTTLLARGSHHRVMSTDAIHDAPLPVHLLGGTAAGQPTETDPLFPGARPRKNPFYRARPLW